MGKHMTEGKPKIGIESKNELNVRNMLEMTKRLMEHGELGYQQKIPSGT